jgi:hypothetical protein
MLVVDKVSVWYISQAVRVHGRHIHMGVLVWIEVVASVVFEEYHVDRARSEHPQCETKDEQLHRCGRSIKRMPFSRRPRKERRFGLV